MNKNKIMAAATLLAEAAKQIQEYYALESAEPLNNCDKCDGFYYRKNSFALMTNPIQYEHVCNKCADEVKFLMSFTKPNPPLKPKISIPPGWKEISLKETKAYKQFNLMADAVTYIAQVIDIDLSKQPEELKAFFTCDGSHGGGPHQ